MLLQRLVGLAVIFIEQHVSGFATDSDTGRAGGRGGANGRSCGAAGKAGDTVDRVGGLARASCIGAVVDDASLASAGAEGLLTRVCARECRRASVLEIQASKVSGDARIICTARFFHWGTSILEFRVIEGKQVTVIGHTPIDGNDGVAGLHKPGSWADVLQVAALIGAEVEQRSEDFSVGVRLS